MSTLDDIKVLITGVDTFIGYSDTDSMPPFVALRPLNIDAPEVSVAGNAFDWDTEYSAYCAAGSVAASYNLAVQVINQVQGKRVNGTTLSASMGYVGAQVEGHYESQVTIQLNQGVLS